MKVSIGIGHFNKRGSKQALGENYITGMTGQLS